MTTYILLFFIIFLTGPSVAHDAFVRSKMVRIVPDNTGKSFETDSISTPQGTILITFIGHGTLMFEYNNLIIHVDPVSRYADYTKLPKADIILVTHHHGDHLDPGAIHVISQEKTKILLTASCTDKFTGATVIRNGEQQIINGLKILAVPAYNLVHKRRDGSPFHPKGEGNGYVITFGKQNIYIAGDTENFPEMENLPDIDIAFLPMNLPYTMTPGMVADAVSMIAPKILYPYHFGETNMDELLVLLKDNNDIEIRIRNMK